MAIISALVLAILMPAAALMGMWLAFKLAWTLLKYNFNKFDKWLDSP